MAYYKNSEELLTEDSFVRWIEDRASCEEENYWMQWMQEDPARQTMVREAKELHRALTYDQFDLPDVEKELAQLETTITVHEEANRKRATKRPDVYRWMRVAVVILLMASVSWGVYMWAPQQISEGGETAEWIVKKTDFGEKRKLHLSDGSTVVLNSNSQLQYPSQYSGGDLQVQLQGEAYFDITHKTGTERRKFLIQTGQGMVRVLGTKFNVNTRSDQTEVVLQKGKVEVVRVDADQVATSAYQMTPGELARLDSRHHQIGVQQVNPAIYTSWTQDRLIFEATALKKIADRIETTYGIEVQIASPDLAETRVSGTVSNDNLPVLLASLSRLLKADIDRKDQHIIIK